MGNLMCTQTFGTECMYVVSEFCEATSLSSALQSDMDNFAGFLSTGDILKATYIALEV